MAGDTPIASWSRSAVLIHGSRRSKRERSRGTSIRAPGLNAKDINPRLKQATFELPDPDNNGETNEGGMTTPNARLRLGDEKPDDLEDAA
jgi:hypothetical protein